MPRINSPRMFSSKNTIDKMAMETGLEEKSKIKCAKKHFEALGEKVEFMAPESNPDEFMEKARYVFA